MPTGIGETIQFNMYEDCGMTYIRPVLVTRCTTDQGGLVYRIDGNVVFGTGTICGMD